MKSLTEKELVKQTNKNIKNFLSKVLRYESERKKMSKKKELNGWIRSSNNKMRDGYILNKRDITIVPTMLCMRNTSKYYSSFDRLSVIYLHVYSSP